VVTVYHICINRFIRVGRRTIIIMCPRRDNTMLCPPIHCSCSLGTVLISSVPLNSLCRLVGDFFRNLPSPERGLYRIYLTKLYHSLSCNTARARYTYTAHSRLIFTAKPPTLSSAARTHSTIYIRSGECTTSICILQSLNGGGIQAVLVVITM